MRVELVEEGGRKVYRYFSVDKPSEEVKDEIDSPGTLLGQSDPARKSRRSIKVVRDGQEVLEPLIPTEPTLKDIEDMKKSGLFGSPKPEMYSPEKKQLGDIHLVNSESKVFENLPENDLKEPQISVAEIETGVDSNQPEIVKSQQEDSPHEHLQEMREDSQKNGLVKDQLNEKVNVDVQNQNDGQIATEEQTKPDA